MQHTNSVTTTQSHTAYDQKWHRWHYGSDSNDACHGGRRGHNSVCSRNLGKRDIFQKMTQKSIIHAGESENRPVKSDLLSSSHLKKINHPSGLLWTSKQPVSGFVITRSVLDFEDTCISWKPALSDSFREFPEGLEDKIVRQDHGRHYSNGETNRRGARPELSWNIYACVLVFRK